MLNLLVVESFVFRKKKRRGRDLRLSSQSAVAVNLANAMRAKLFLDRFGSTANYCQPHFPGVVLPYIPVGGCRRSRREIETEEDGLYPRR